MTHRLPIPALTAALLTLTSTTLAPAQTFPATTRPAWANPQPQIAYLEKPTTRPADWLVEHDPVTPNASPEAKALLKFLYAISLHHTLTGQHNFPGEQEYSTALMARIAHKTPAIYGTDWGFARDGDKDSAFVRADTVAELIKQYRAGSIIALCWHEVRPTEDEPVTFKGSVQGKLTDDQFDALITPGSALYQRWCAQVDVAAGYMKQLQEARVPILFRPYHEMNGDWFWWGGRRGQRLGGLVFGAGAEAGGYKGGGLFARVGEGDRSKLQRKRRRRKRWSRSEAA